MDRSEALKIANRATWRRKSHTENTYYVEPYQDAGYGDSNNNLPERLPTGDSTQALAEALNLLAGSSEGMRHNVLFSDSQFGVGGSIVTQPALTRLADARANFPQSAGYRSKQVD